MRKVFLFSFLLVLGLAGSQFRSGFEGPVARIAEFIIRHGTYWCLAFIMIGVGLEFDIDKRNLRGLGWDYVVAATAAAFPWIFVSVYFVAFFEPAGAWRTFTAWKEVLLASRFAAPTSAGILFSMLAAAGLAGTWAFRKVRILAIFDDLDTVLLMIPLKIMIVGMKWQLGVVVVVMVVLLVSAWRYLRRLDIPSTTGWLMAYAAGMVAVTESVYAMSKYLDDVVPIHIEILLPAFVLGCMLRRGQAPIGADGAGADTAEHHGDDPVATGVSAVFMLLAGLSMPLIDSGGMSGAAVVLHVIAVTLIANLGKMFPVFCYRREATIRERLAVCIGMWPRGEVGAGILILSTGYGIGGPMIAVAGLSLALNLVLTGPFILVVRALLKPRQAEA